MTSSLDCGLVSIERAQTWNWFKTSHEIYGHAKCFQTNIATSLGLTLSPYFCLKHSMNKLRGDSVPKSTWLFGEAPSKVLANSLVAFFNSLRRSDISWLCPRQASHWVLLSLLVVIELVWQLLSIRKPTCYDKLCQLRCNSTKRKQIFFESIHRKATPAKRGQNYDMYFRKAWLILFFQKWILKFFCSRSVVGEEMHFRWLLDDTVITITLNLYQETLFYFFPFLNLFN